MKKILLITAAMVATLSPIAAQARDNRPDRHEIRDAKKDLREARQDYREDWQDYRRDHRETFRGSRFNAPFKYRSFNTGARLTVSYYQPRYYVNNYSAYRLKAPGYNQRYVRHYNDLLLVNVRTGVVVKAYRNFYW